MPFERQQVPGAVAPHAYIDMPTIPGNYSIVEIGPGRYPFPRADAYVDHDPEMLAPLQEIGKETHLANFEDGLPQIRDGAFDYCYASHILEHVDDPLACARTMSRIARNGTIVMPSAIKESIFLFEEPQHKWLVHDNPSGGPPIFIRHSKKIARIKDEDIQKTMCRLFRTGTIEENAEDKYALEWFRRTETDLDVVYHWSGSLGLIVHA